WRGQARRRQAFQCRLRRQGAGRGDRQGARQAGRGRTSQSASGGATRAHRQPLTALPKNKKASRPTLAFLVKQFLLIDDKLLQGVLVQYAAHRNTLLELADRKKPRTLQLADLK